jgi:hypothetical protein
VKQLPWPGEAGQGAERRGAVRPGMVRRGEPRGGPRWKVILCAGDCGRKFSVIEAVDWILCSKPSCTLNRLREKRASR